MSAAPEGLDWRQWRALVRAGLRQDLRRAGRSLGLATGSQSGGLVTLLVFQVALGVAVSVPIWTTDEAFAGATIHLTYVSLSVAALLLLDGSALIASTADHALVGPRPVSSRTFLTARATTLCAYALAVALAQSVGPLAAYAFAGGPRPGRAVIGLLATLSVSLTTAGVVVWFYAAVVGWLPARYVRAGLTLLQLVFSFVLYGGLALLPSRLVGSWVAGPIGDRPSWIWLLPTAWAAWLVGTEGAWGWGAAALLPPLLAWAAASRTLSIGLVATATEVAPPSSARSRAVALRWFGRGERYAVAQLARAQFRDDLRFRLGVLSIVPLTVLYFLISAFDERLALDPHGHPPLVYVAVLVFPALLKGAFSRSDAFRAAWVFHASPVRAGRLIVALRDVLVAWFVLPYVAAVFLLLVVVLPSALEALLSVAVLVLIAHLSLLLMLAVDPALPFSAPPQVAANTRSVTVAVLPALLVGQLLPAALVRLAGSPALATISLVFLVAANVTAEWLLRRRVDRLAARVEFAG